MLVIILQGSSTQGKKKIIDKYYFFINFLRYTLNEKQASIFIFLIILNFKNKEKAKEIPK